MRKKFDQYCDIVLADATYKINELLFPVYLLLVIDANGESEVVVTFIVREESEVLLDKCVSCFKENNQNCDLVQVIMTDKDMVERNVFARQFPTAKLVLCLFHVQQNFRREITTEKMSITQQQRTQALDILSKITYSRSVEQYIENRQKLYDLNVKKITEYFDKNWDGIRNEWVEGLKSQNVTLQTSTTNRVESINQKMKQVCNRDQSLEQFATSLLQLFQSLRVQRQHSTLKSTMKIPVLRENISESEAAYHTLLTPYAMTFVKKSMELYSKVQVQVDENGAATCDSSSGTINISTSSCGCSRFKSMQLPCHHIFALRHKIGENLFSESLVPKR